MIKAPTLQLYIARRFILGIFATFLVCSILIFLIDFVELLRQSGKYGSVPLPRLAWLALLRLPAYTEFLIGFAVLVGSIGALLFLSRKSELTVMRAGGMSAWQFLTPGVLVAFLFGLFGLLAYNPLAAAAKTESERQYALAFGRDSNLLQANRTGGSWLRQDGADGQSVISAAHASKRGLSLTGVTAFVFDPKGAFVERIDAAGGELKEGYWQLKDAWVVRIGREPEKFETYLVSTYLTPERAQDALGSVNSVSFWELPALIEVTEKAKLSSERLRVQYELLLSRPLLCVCMVLLAATVSLRSFRSGRIRTMVVRGMLGGFGFFLIAEISRQIGIAGLAPPRVAVWVPVVFVALVSTTVLLHQEDG